MLNVDCDLFDRLLLPLLIALIGSSVGGFIAGCLAGRAVVRYQQKRERLHEDESTLRELDAAVEFLRAGLQPERWNAVCAIANKLQTYKHRPIQQELLEIIGAGSSAPEYRDRLKRLHERVKAALYEEPY